MQSKKKRNAEEHDLRDAEFRQKAEEEESKMEVDSEAPADRRHREGEGEGDDDGVVEGDDDEWVFGRGWDAESECSEGGSRYIQDPYTGGSESENEHEDGEESRFQIISLETEDEDGFKTEVPVYAIDRSQDPPSITEIEDLVRYMTLEELDAMMSEELASEQAFAM